MTIPPTRSDVIHACDIWEDAAIAYGYNNIARVDPSVATYGKQQPVNQLSDHLRLVISQAGYSEALTFALCSTDDAFKFLRREDDGRTAATIANPVTEEFQIVRVNLLSGLLKTISENRFVSTYVSFVEDPYRARSGDPALAHLDLLFSDDTLCTTLCERLFNM